MAYRTDWTKIEWHSPQWRRRKHWDEDRIAGESFRPRSVRPWLRACEGCRFLIGPDYWQRELFIEPWLEKATIRWRYICGMCAIENGLGRGYCLVAEPDYRAGYPAVFGNVKAALARKIAGAKDAFIQAWSAYAAEWDAEYVRLRERWQAAQRYRDEAILRRIFDETHAQWAGYLDCYQTVRMRDWYRRFDRDGQGCPERHQMPSVCARSFHKRLWPLSVLALFHTFRAGFEPEPWTISDHLRDGKAGVA